MKIILWINRVLLTLLSISTGAVKLAQMEEEMHIFRVAGSPDWATMAFGAIQVLGGILLIIPKTTRVGAWVMLPTFILATGVLFINEMMAFGVASFLFIAMAALHGSKWPRD